MCALKEIWQYLSFRCNLLLQNAYMHFHHYAKRQIAAKGRGERASEEAAIYDQ